MDNDAEIFPAHARLIAEHDLWLIRMASKGRMWKTIAPAIRAGLDDAAIVQNCRYQIHRLEMLTKEILERWPHLEPQVIAALERASGKR